MSALVIVAAALDRELFQLLCIKPQPPRLMQQRREMRRRAKFFGQCWPFLHDAKVTQNEREVNAFSGDTRIHVPVH